MSQVGASVINQKAEASPIIIKLDQSPATRAFTDQGGNFQVMIKRILHKFFAGIAFYTCFPVPHQERLDFHGIAHLAPLIGLLIGACLGLIDWGLQYFNWPILTRSALLVALWVAITGGLHLDGAMDTADGLAVTDPQRRLAVMADSVTGAFGAMTAGIILLLKTVALSNLTHDRPLLLMAIAGWGRWGQLVAIARYPYLKPTGKGAFHKAAIKSLWSALPSLVLLLGLSSYLFWARPDRPWMALGLALGGGAIAVLTGAWFNHKLGGHTGDTYGAVVEWTEALLLCVMTGV
jgi:adenosylcobinamide-GDP ribazoletransferase